MARILCSSCGAAIAPANVDLSTRLAKCECGDVFAFEAQLREQDGAPAVARRRDLATPQGWTVEGTSTPPRATEPGYRAPAGATSGALVLTRRWFRLQALFLAVFCVCWDSFLVFWYGTALMTLTSGDAPAAPTILMLVFPLLHVVVGVGLTYYTLALFLNRTVLRIEGRDATVKHGPLRWRGDKQVSLVGLRSVFVKRDKSPLGQRNVQSWAVVLDTDGDAALPLVTGLPSEDDARFVAAHVADREKVSGP
ncbi:MAG: hypothetical protein M3Y87_31810 [Myxococcota bacterium]|nr:hypothetical protein [Myxococcota bacterium]